MVIAEQKKLEQHGYEREQLLGEGAFARVWQVRSLGNGNRYACKISKETALLRREADNLRQMEHPLFPHYREYWEEIENACLVMELVHGISLKELVDRRGRMTQKQAIWIAREVASGLSILHGQSFNALYRDLKPEHVYIREDGSIKLLDMGCVCRKDHAGSLAGTPGYAAPEQLIHGRCQGSYSDVYAWGRLLIYMLTGECILHQDSLPQRLEYFLARCTDTDVAGRFPDFRAVMSELDRLEATDGYKGKGFFDNLFQKKMPHYNYLKSAVYHAQKSKN